MTINYLAESPVTTDNIALWIGIAIAITGSIAGLVKDWKKPSIDKATTEKLKTEVQAANMELNLDRDRLNAWRDRRVLDLERWADQIRPVMWARDQRIDLLTRLVIEDHEALQKTCPPLPPMPEWPPFPEPRPLPGERQD